MALTIDDPEVDRLAQELAERTGTTVTEAVRSALRERLDRAGGHVVTDPVVAEALARARRKPRDPDLAAKLDALAKECAALPDFDTRSPEEIVGYDEHGAPR
jgi:antitoxin VapB